MELQPKLHMKQTQQLIMTPRLQQALKLLQLPTMELEQILKQEVLLNPMLEMVDEYEEKQEIDESGEENDSDTPESEAEEQTKEDPLEEYFEKFDDPDTYYSKEEREEKEHYERTPVYIPQFQESLLSQLRMTSLNEEELMIGDYIIGNLDDSGYLLCCTVQDIAEDLDVDESMVEKVLEVIQNFEPSGVGARNLRECLLIQLRKKGFEGSLPWILVSDHFEEIEKNRYSQLIKTLKTTSEEMSEARDIIRNLNPKPGESDASGENRYVIPDLIVERIEDNYIVYLNDKNVPRLQVNRAYKSLLKSPNNSNDDTRAYLNEKFQSAKWLIKTIEQRRQTMLKVMNYIVKHQQDFFEKGINYLRPLTLAEVADSIGMHESTVSRVTNNKYVQTPRGVFELKFFFSSSINTQDGNAIAARSAKQRILDLIQSEDPKKPYSDQEIVKALKKEGIVIARRTVAKYRDQLKILPARLRKIL
jgi:RNA polymerase sigma-54 factor